jgi:hypothetical protein
MFFAKPWVCCGLENGLIARAFGEKLLLYFRRLGPIFTNMPPQIFPRKKHKLHRALGQKKAKLWTPSTF